MSSEDGAGGMRVLPAGPFGAMLEFDEVGRARRCYRLIERLRGRAGVVGIGGDGEGTGGRVGSRVGGGVGVGGHVGEPGSTGNASANAGRGDDDLASIVDVVPAERTILVISSFNAAGRSALRSLIAHLRDMDWTVSAVDNDGSQSPEVVLPVRYDGPDLADVAELTGLSPTEVVRLHTEAEFTVAFTGFAPGFAYLAGLPTALAVPRRNVPRTRVETGAVGLAGAYSGVYPRSSPGGWQIIGHLADMAEALWDPRRDPPALLQPGVRVRFRAETQADDG